MLSTLPSSAYILQLPESTKERKPTFFQGVSEDIFWGGPLFLRPPSFFPVLRILLRPRRRRPRPRKKAASSAMGASLRRGPKPKVSSYPLVMAPAEFEWQIESAAWRSLLSFLRGLASNSLSCWLGKKCEEGKMSEGEALGEWSSAED